ncbi:MAG: serine hydrolase [Gemmatimonadaceae bacterium]|nr:serine hydrolase [Gemmatimonadaceae bacterium]
MPAPRWEPSMTAPLNADATAWIEGTLSSLTLRERVAQMVTVWLLGDYTSTTDPSYVEAVDWVVKDRVGGIVMSLGTPIEVAAKVNDLQRLAKVPLLISSDLEPGLGRLEGGVFTPYTYRAGSATMIPSNMAIGATGDAQLAAAAGRITGAEARAVGIHMAFAPTIDVNNNPSNPVINTRSFGEDPAAVARLATAFVRGVQAEGTLATLKHFPGHGDTDTDSHLALPVVRSDRARLDAMELVPYRDAIAAGAAGVMTAHIALPAIGGDSTPATLRTEIVTALLRDTLQFRGLTSTDALSMEGIGAGFTVEKSAVLSVLAGADILLKPTDPTKAIDAVVAAVERGEITRARIDQSVRRLLEWKLRAGAIHRPLVPLDTLRMVVGAQAHRDTAALIATRAITLIRDQASLVPLAPGPATLHVAYAQEVDVDAGTALAAELRRTLKGMRFVRVGPRTSRTELDSIARTAERVIFSTHGRAIEGEGRPAISVVAGQWIDSLSTVKPVVAVAHGNPYMLRQFPRVGSYLVTYGTGAVLERAAARAIVGTSAITGRAPISLPGLFSIGDGQQRRARAVTPNDQDGDMPLARDPLTDSLTQLLARAVADSAFPGAIAVVGRRDRVLATATAGHIDWASGSPAPTDRTVWDLASLTKVVALTSAMMQLVEQGKVDLDAPVQRYLPEWRGAYKDRVRVRDLLTHSSGLPGWRPLYKEATTPDSALALVFSQPLDTVPGARMVYSDLGAILLGQIAVRVSGERFDRYVDQHVFAPLGMTETRFLPPSSWHDRIAPTEIDPWRQRHLRGEVHDENAAALGGVSSHAGLFSTAHDLTRFAQMYLSAGALGGARVFAPATVARFTAVQDSTFSHRALGWETPTGSNSAGRLMTRPAFGHTGFTGTSLWIDPAHDLFVLLLTNRVNPTRQNTRIGAVRQAVADLAERVAGAR